jgi:hypothetical protein
MNLILQQRNAWRRTMCLLMLTAQIVTAPASFTRAQMSLESAILRRAAATIRKMEPSWKFTSGICNCPPLMKEQVGVAVGSWQQQSVDASQPRTVLVRIHRSENAEAAAQWLDRHAHGRLPEGWTIGTYDFADGATMSQHAEPPRFELCFRKGQFLGFVSAESKADVEWFGRHVFAEVANSQ